MAKIDTKEFIKLKNENPDLRVFDVRNLDEYTYKHIEGAKLIPLNELDQRLAEIPKDEKVYMLCRTGNRSGKACDMLAAAGYKNVVNIDGGITEYERQGGQVVKKSKVLPMLQQVQIVAGFLTLLGVVLSLLIHPAWAYLSGFVGLGLMFAGFTGLCPMLKLIEAMPWNKEQASKDEYCKPCGM